MAPVEGRGTGGCHDLRGGEDHRLACRQGKRRVRWTRSWQRSGTQFTCFTGTKVQILTVLRRSEAGRQTRDQGDLLVPSTITDAFPGTKVQILTRLAELRDGSPWHEEPRAHLDIGVGCVVKAVGRDRDYRSGVVERAEDNGDFRIQWEAAGASPSEALNKASLRGPH
jgi:hypothetical protein